MKMIIEQNEIQIKTKSNIKAKIKQSQAAGSNLNTMIILSSKEHEVISKFYSKLDEISLK